MNQTLDNDTLLKIRTWYEEIYQGLDKTTEYRKSRWYITERIRVLNLMLLQNEETSFLEGLNALFIQHIDSVEDVPESTGGLENEWE
tara:strand:- start:210 stop:470 length:261 start_codon:yes stop_codon:yes gene_type:complete